jgi:diguanylate cyclase (GGDEF)-like protein/PAS domain S-box-containing protein
MHHRSDAPDSGPIPVQGGPAERRGSQQRDAQPQTGTSGQEEPRHTLAQDAISAFTHAPIGVAIAAADGVVTRTNPALSDLLGYPENDLLGRDLFRLVPPELVDAAIAACMSLQDGSADTVVHETRFVTAAGAVIDVRVTTSAVRTPTTGQPHAIMHLEDITERVHLRQRLEHQASHDHLTGLPNRANFLAQLHRAQARSRRHHQPLTLIYLDLDDFKTINDTLGHATGDQLLIAFAEHLRRSVRPEDLPARLGGDEFVVLCQETTREEAAFVIDRLAGPDSSHWVKDLPAVIDAFGGHVTVSAGMATTDPDVETSAADGFASPEDLLHAADQAMYMAKATTTEGR